MPFFFSEPLIESNMYTVSGVRIFVYNNEPRSKLGTQNHKYCNLKNVSIVS
jgi:hypothetical protein